MYRPEEHPFGLLPPPYYCGRQLRQKKEDFNLPHDIWHLHATDSLPARDIVASWNYKKIKNNIYSTDGRYMQSFETPNCHCKVPQSEEEMGCTLLQEPQWKALTESLRQGKATAMDVGAE